MDKKIPLEWIEEKSHFIRGEKVMVDSDLAEIYGVSLKTLLERVIKNRQRFPSDFMFRLNCEEYSNLKPQGVVSKQIGKKHLPLAFTENGIAMLSSILRSEKAIEINIQIIRTLYETNDHEGMLA